MQIFSDRSQTPKGCDSIYMTGWKRQNYRVGVQISGCQGLSVREGLNKQEETGTLTGNNDKTVL